MSTFEGKIVEIPGISVDRFNGQNLYSSAYFLSHCHADHMIGLNCTNFQQQIIKDRKFLYTSSVSALILRGMYSNISSQIRELPLEQVTSIAVGDKHISVSCLPAGHCPGSVMFLFESDESRVLYTGDYRINSSDYKKFKWFYDAFDNVKAIDKIYLDTTFFLKSYKIFPKREDSLLELCKVISCWLSQDPQNCVKIISGANYGYEYVFKDIYDRCKIPVNVDSEKYKFYSLIPELDGCVTTNRSSNRIDFGRWGRSDMINFNKMSNVRIIKLSAFRWEDRDFENGLTEVDENGNFFICYSTHASYEEGVALIDFLKPKQIHVCVERPSDPATTRTIQKLIEEKLDEIHGRNKTIEKPKLFKIETRNSEVSRQTELKESPPKKILKCDSLLDSPPR